MSTYKFHALSGGDWTIQRDSGNIIEGSSNSQAVAAVESGKVVVVTYYPYYKAIIDLSTNTVQIDNVDVTSDGAAAIVEQLNEEVFVGSGGGGGTGEGWGFEGNTLSGEGILGTTSNHSLSIITDDTERINISNDGVVYLPDGEMHVGDFVYPDNSRSIFVASHVIEHSAAIGTNRVTVGVGGYPRLNKTGGAASECIHIGGAFEAMVGPLNTSNISSTDGVQGMRSSYCVLPGATGTITNGTSSYIGSDIGGCTTVNRRGAWIDTPYVHDGAVIQNNIGLEISDQSSVGTVSAYNLVSKGSTSINLLEGLLVFSGTANVSLRNISPLSNIGELIFRATNGTNTATSLTIAPKGTGYDASFKAGINLYNTDYGADASNFEVMGIAGSATEYTIGAFAFGTGTRRPIYLHAVGSFNAATANLVIATNGATGIRSLNLTPFTPANSTDNTWGAGTFAADDTNIYFRTAGGTWKKIALTAF